MVVDNIIFDWCDVFSYGLRHDGAMGRLMETELGISREEYAKTHDFRFPLTLQMCRGELKEVEHWRRVIKEMHWDVPVSRLILVSRMAMDTEIPGMINLLKRIDRQEHNLFLVTDMWPEMKRDMRIAYPWVDRVFSKCYFSCDMGRVKRDPGTFDFVIRDAEIFRENTIFVDDSQENVELAEDAGLTGIVFSSAEELEEDLLGFVVLQDEIGG